MSPDKTLNVFNEPTQINLDTQDCALVLSADEQLSVFVPNIKGQPIPPVFAMMLGLQISKHPKAYEARKLMREVLEEEILSKRGTR